MLGRPRRQRRDDLLAEEQRERAVRSLQGVLPLVGRGAPETVTLVETFQVTGEDTTRALAHGDRLDLAADCHLVHRDPPRAGPPGRRRRRVTQV
jgi:hypothetical protein